MLRTDFVSALEFDFSFPYSTVIMFVKIYEVIHSFFSSAPGLFMKDFIQFIQLVDKNTPVSPSSELTLHCHKIADGLYELAKKG